AGCDRASASPAPTGTQSAPPGAQLLYLIRHAEKPTGKGAPYGVDEDGEKDKHSLTPRGWTRAGALIGLFTSGYRGIMLPRTIFAARPDGSKRPLETVTPLARRVGLAVDATIGPDDAAAAAAAATRAPGVSVMAWEHHAIPAIAAALGTVEPRPPAAWPGDRFDVVWEFTRDGLVWRFTQIPQLLLDGDRSTGI
ncbi:hypothetical protein, partial [Tsukamurella soli]|uniref:hypothetical protein n=1 Tax=Tsukamurella soli TaxID=644556 RepID=UPI0031E56EFA